MDMYTGAPARLMEHVQMLVKRFDGRFIGYKWQFNRDVQYFSLYFSDNKQCERFNRMMRILHQPYF